MFLPLKISIVGLAAATCVAAIPQHYNVPEALLIRDGTCRDRGSVEGAWASGPSQRLAQIISYLQGAQDVTAAHNVDQWIAKMAKGDDTDVTNTGYDCGTLDLDLCPNPANSDELRCDKIGPDLFYILTSFSNLHGTFKAISDNMFQAGLIQSLNIPAILDDFSGLIKNIQDTIDAQDVSKGITLMLAIITAGAGLIPGAGPFLAAGGSVASGIYAATINEGGKIDVKGESENSMSVYVGKLLDSYKVGVITFLSSIYNVPKGQDLINTLANGQFLEPFHFNVNTWENMKHTIEAGMIGALYTGAGAHVVQGTYPPELCGLYTYNSGFVVEGTCMWIATRGSDSPLLYEDSYKPLQDHGIDALAVMLNSRDCSQNRNGQLAPFDPTRSDLQVAGYPPCFFRLPFEVKLVP